MSSSAWAKRATSSGVVSPRRILILPSSTSVRIPARMAASRIESIGAQVRANEIAVEGSRQEALVGQRTTLDVLDQESDLFQSQVDLVRARRDQIIASYRLKAAIGQLTPGGIDLPVQEYDAEAYYNDTRNRWTGLGEPRDGNR